MTSFILRAWINDEEMLNKINESLKTEEKYKRVGMYSSEYIEYIGTSQIYSKFIGRILYQIHNVEIIPELINILHIINKAHIELLINDEWKGLKVE